MKNKMMKMILDKYPDVKKTVDRITNWDSNLTLKGNSEKLNIRHTSAYFLAKKFDLKYIPSRGKVMDEDKFLLIRELRQKGMTYQAIATLFGVSRQAIHSILKAHKDY